MLAQRGSRSARPRARPDPLRATARAARAYALAAQPRQPKGRTAHRALGLLPEEPSIERALLLAWLARTRSCAAATARRSLKASARWRRPSRRRSQRRGRGAQHAGDGPDRAGRGRSGRGAAAAGDHVGAASRDDIDDMGYRLRQSGRPAWPRGTHRRGAHRWSKRAWPQIARTVRPDSRLDDDDASPSWRSRPATGMPPGRPGPAAARWSASLLMFRLLREAELALGEGDDERRRRLPGGGRTARARVQRGAVARRASARCSASSGDAAATWRGARGGGQGARRARGLHRRRDADRPRERDRGCGSRPTARSGRATSASPAEARDALARARIHLDRLEAAAQDGGPVEPPGCRRRGRRWPRARGAQRPARCGSGGRQPGTSSSGRTARPWRAGARRRRWSRRGDRAAAAERRAAAVAAAERARRAAG